MTPIERERDTAETMAWNALGRYKFLLFGYWAGLWIHLNRLCPTRSPNPWRDLVADARRRNP